MRVALANQARYMEQACVLPQLHSTREDRRERHSRIAKWERCDESAPASLLIGGRLLLFRPEYALLRVCETLFLSQAGGGGGEGRVTAARSWSRAWPASQLFAAARPSSSCRNSEQQQQQQQQH